MGRGCKKKVKKLKVKAAFLILYHVHENKRVWLKELRFLLR